MNNIRSLNQDAPVILCSTKTGHGLAELAAALENLIPTIGAQNVSSNASADHSSLR
jgi:hypothetical protein